MQGSSQAWQLRQSKSQPSMLDSPGVSNFIGNLCKMLEDSYANAFVRWGMNKDSLVILDHVRFSTLVLPKYYKHSNFASFVRQLNLYGFRKISQDVNSCEFSHPEFRCEQFKHFKNISSICIFLRSWNLNMR